MIQLFPSNSILVQKTDTLFKVIDQVLFLNTSKYTVARKQLLVGYVNLGLLQAEKLSKERGQRERKKGRDEGNGTIL